MVTPIVKKVSKQELRGTNFDDILSGGQGNDKIRGGKGDDELRGGKGNDILIGGDGDDALFGGDGDDLLQGGKGADTMRGGAGNDVFRIFGQHFDEQDTIQDFTKGEDKLNFAGNYVQGTSSFTQNGNIVSFDFDGDSNVDYTLKLTNGITLDSSDIQMK